jgi:hypothetical protein
MTRKELLRTFKLDAVYGLDFETYYDDTLSLRKMATTEYITHPDMEVQLVAVQKDSWAKAKVMTAKEFASFARTVNWANTGLLAHHTHFDGLLASHFFKVKPRMYFDTLSMARPVMPVQVGGSLAKLCAAFGLAGKRGAEALVNVKGVRFKQFDKKMIADLKYYAGGDIEQTWLLFDKLLPFCTLEELRVISTTIKMYAQPRLLIDKAMVEQVKFEENEKKEDLIADAGTYAESLRSDARFAGLLRVEGVHPPTKISAKTGKVNYAFSKTNPEFKALLNHPSEPVRALVKARLAVKSTNQEKRAERMAFRADIGAQPIYLNYWGAKTGRWSGGDKANWQNMQRGSALRRSLMAPKGYQLIIADQAQIEARLNAWFHNQTDVVEAFAKKQDVYKLAASRIYGIPYDVVDKDQRFVGKVAVLALGYGAGSARFAEMLRLGAFGPAVNISDADAKVIVDAWRRANAFIVGGWRKANNNLRMAFLNGTTVPDRVLEYQGHGAKGITLLPNGTYIRYDGVELNDENELTYISSFRRLMDGTVNYDRQKLYGGLIVENDIQALGRAIIAENVLSIEDAVPSAQLVMTTHDEVVFCVPDRYAPKALKSVVEVMTTPPKWADGLPLGVDAHISDRYDK